MEGIKKLFDTFYQENRNNDLIMSKDQIIQLINSSFSWSSFFTKKNEIKSKVNTDEIIIGIKDYVIFTETKFFVIENGFGGVLSFELSEFLKIGGKPAAWGSTGNITINNKEVAKVTTMKKQMFELFDHLKSPITEHLKHIQEQNKLKLLLEEKEFTNKEKRKIYELKELQNSIFSEFNKSINGEIVLIENDFLRLLNKNQKKLIEIDKNYIHQLVKISNYTKTKRNNIQNIFKSINDTNSKIELDERVKLLKNQIYTYELLVFHSISMIGAIVEDDFITFYEIYESFDKLGIYNSNWENEVSEKLLDIGQNFDALLFSINQMEINIVNEIANLSYLTQESFSALSHSVSNQLDEIGSNLKFNNLLTGIQTYQLYKINKQIKPTGK